MKTRKIGLLVLVAVLLPLLGSTAPPSAAVASQAQSTSRVSFNGISFTYDSSLASGVATSIVPEDKGAFHEACWSIHPDETVFEFKDFAYSTVNSWADIYIFPATSDYPCLNESGSIDFWGREIRALGDLLARRPKLQEAPGVGGTTPFPFLPPENAAEILLGKQQYLNFQNGSGLRYLIQITQEASKPNHENSLYTYQGISNDGRYYVAAHLSAFPVALASKPPEGFTGNEDLIAYYRQFRAAINATPNRDFHPNLDLLDDMIRSLTINSSAVKLPSGPAGPPAPGLPRSGMPLNEPASALLTLVSALALTLISVGMAMRSKRASL